MNQSMSSAWFRGIGYGQSGRHRNQLSFECLLFVDRKDGGSGRADGLLGKARVSADVCAPHRPGSVGRVGLSVTADAKLPEVIVPLGPGQRTRGESHQNDGGGHGVAAPTDHPRLDVSLGFQMPAIRVDPCC